MPKLLQINVCANWGSTGKIAEQLNDYMRYKGWKTFFAYGRSVNPNLSHLIHIGNKFFQAIALFEARLFDNDGLSCRFATMRLIKKIKKVKPDIIHISKYMHRPGAISNSLDEIDHKVMKDRSHRVNDVKSEVMLENNKKYEGTTQRVLIIGEGSTGGYVGYTDTYKNVIVDNAKIGTFVNVKILEGKRTYLLAEVIQ